MKRLTIARAKHPGGLGAKPKRDRSSTRAYPTLPTTEEEEDENETNKTTNWINNKSINRKTKQAGAELGQAQPQLGLESI